MDANRLRSCKIFLFFFTCRLSVELFVQCVTINESFLKLQIMVGFFYACCRVLFFSRSLIINSPMFVISLWRIFQPHVDMGNFNNSRGSKQYCVRTSCCLLDHFFFVFTTLSVVSFRAALCNLGTLFAWILCKLERTKTLMIFQFSLSIRFLFLKLYLSRNVFAILSETLPHVLPWLLHRSRIFQNCSVVGL